MLPYTTTLLYTHYIYIDIDIYMCTRLVPVHCSRIGEGERIRNTWHTSHGSTDIPGIPHESWHGRIKEVVLADDTGENRIYPVRSNLSYRRRGVK